MTNLRKHCLIGSTGGKNENGCVSNEKKKKKEHTCLNLSAQVPRSQPHYLQIYFTY